MRAMLLEQIGQPLQLRELPVPQPGPGEVRVRVLACGVCRTDLHVVDGELPEAPLPIIPGHEIVGRVDALGEGVTGFELGQRVGIHGWGTPAAPAATANTPRKISATRRSSPVTRGPAATPNTWWPTHASPLPSVRRATPWRWHRCSAPG